jgi:hypothetical protein
MPILDLDHGFGQSVIGAALSPRTRNSITEEASGFIGPIGPTGTILAVVALAR